MSKPLGVLNNSTGIACHKSLKSFPSRPLADVPQVRDQGAACALQAVHWRFLDAQDQWGPPLTCYELSRIV